MVSVIAVDAPGVLAFVIAGRLTRADYRDVLLPPIREVIAKGEEIRVLAVLERFQGLEAGGLLEELKAAAMVGSAQDALRSYFAVVTDADWVRRSIALFGWLVPGEVRVFTSDRRAEAETWLADAR
jgi:SpoIIAA-like